MIKAEQFREYAGEALRWSLLAKTEPERQALLQLARTWTEAALYYSERRRPEGRIWPPSDQDERDAGGV